MKKIINQKLLTKFGTLENLAVVTSKKISAKVKENQLVQLHALAKHINIINDINYHYEDFLIDYHDEISKYLEKELVFRIWSSGITLVEYARNHNIREGTFLNELKRGIRKNVILITEPEFQTASFHINELHQDVKSFNMIFKSTFMKLIGNYIDIEVFQEKYSIDFDIIPYSSKYSLVFDGKVYEFLKQFYDS